MKCRFNMIVSGRLWTYDLFSHNITVYTYNPLQPCQCAKCNMCSSITYHWCSDELLRQAASWTDTHTRCCVCPELRGITARGKSQHWEISTCHVPTEVLSAQIVEARVMFPQGWQLWVWVPCQGLAYHAESPIPPPSTIASSPTPTSACWEAKWQLLFTRCLPHFLVFILAGLHGAKGGGMLPL